MRIKQEEPPPPWTGASEGQVAADAPDWNIRGGESSRSYRVRYKQEEPPPSRTGTSRDKWRRTPRTGTSGAEQVAGATV